MEVKEYDESGADVADFFGSLGAIDTGVPYEDVVNSNGNPFQNHTATESVKIFALRNPGEKSLENLKQRLDFFYHIDANTKPGTLPLTYKRVKYEIEEQLKWNRQK